MNRTIAVLCACSAPSVAGSAAESLVKPNLLLIVADDLDWVYLPKQGSLGMTVQSPPGAPWGQPYAKLGLVNSDVDGSSRVKPEAPAVQLYNLATDPGQATNVAVSEPQRVKRMQSRLDELIARPKPAAKPRLDTSKLRISTASSRIRENSEFGLVAGPRKTPPNSHEFGSYLQEHLAEQLRMSDLARHLGLSRARMFEKWSSC
jgi:hypothetical protein